jgi:hypothetical protein
MSTKETTEVTANLLSLKHTLVNYKKPAVRVPHRIKVSLNEIPKCTNYAKNDVALISEKGGGVGIQLYSSEILLLLVKTIADLLALTQGATNHGRQVARRLRHLSSFVWEAYIVNWCVLGMFAKLRRATIGFVMSVRPSVRPSVCPHGTTRFSLQGFS